MYVVSPHSTNVTMSSRPSFLVPSSTVALAERASALHPYVHTYAPRVWLYASCSVSCNINQFRHHSGSTHRSTYALGDPPHPTASETLPFRISHDESADLRNILFEFLAAQSRALVGLEGFALLLLGMEELRIYIYIHSIHSR